MFARRPPRFIGNERVRDEREPRRQRELEPERSVHDVVRNVGNRRGVDGSAERDSRSAPGAGSVSFDLPNLQLAHEIGGESHVVGDQIVEAEGAEDRVVLVRAGAVCVPRVQCGEKLPKRAEKMASPRAEKLPAPSSWSASPVANRASPSSATSLPAGD